ncbi:hypothetical protein [Primorskyibacter sp. S87]|uniref:hypothetical protein n=1 Tax=Primorskyibacter sp. S87 TaxID=3415126 RepID=UPI003C7EB251
MKHFFSFLLCSSVLATALPMSVEAGAVDRACRQSNRTAATPQLCRCIGRVADASLSKSEQRKVAKWFSEPHEAQKVRMSDRRSDEQLWLRYKAFGERAREACS